MNAEWRSSTRSSRSAGALEALAEVERDFHAPVLLASGGVIRAVRLEVRGDGPPLAPALDRRVDRQGAAGGEPVSDGPRSLLAQGLVVGVGAFGVGVPFDRRRCGPALRSSGARAVRVSSASSVSVARSNSKRASAPMTNRRVHFSSSVRIAWIPFGTWIAPGCCQVSRGFWISLGYWRHVYARFRTYFSRCAAFSGHWHSASVRGRWEGGINCGA